jgi:threonine synthase
LRAQHKCKSAGELQVIAEAPGNTPLEDAPDLARWAGLDTLLVKREDLNPTGSHKDRGAFEQVGAMLAAGARVAVISSSGNAALAAAHYATPAGITVVVLVSPRTNPGRVAEVVAAGGRVVVTEKPINFALRLSRVRGWPDLRPSLSEDALRGFRSLGRELVETLPPGTALAGYASSGTTFQAIGEVAAEAGAGLALHPVQAGLVDGFSREFGRPGDGQRSVVGDLGVRVSPRTDRVVGLVRASGGSAWWVNDDEILTARDAISAARHRVAPECWAATAGLRLMAAAGVERACLLLTGRGGAEVAGATASAAAIEGDGPGPIAATFDDVLARVADL